MTTPRPGLAELHLHLFGAIPPAVIRELALLHDVALPALPLDGHGDFDQFQEALAALRPLVTSADELELITYELARELAGQGVDYVEVMTTPAGVEVNRGIDCAEQLATMNRARARARSDFGVEMRWIFEIPRGNLGRSDDSLGYWADMTTEAAIAGRDQGVVALGLSGPEAGHPAEQYEPWFDQARSAGLHSVPHAGEHAGPESVWGAIRALGAERIPHGVRSIEDPALVAYLAEHRIALDVCPTSNVRTGVYRSLAQHPLRRLHESGVALTVNSDDPTMFGTTLSQEIANLTGPLGLSAAAAEVVVANGRRFAFDAVPVPGGH